MNPGSRPFLPEKCVIARIETSCWRGSAGARISKSADGPSAGCVWSKHPSSSEIPGLFILRMQPAGRFRMGDAEPPCCGVGTPRPGAGARIETSCWRGSAGARISKSAAGPSAGCVRHRPPSFSEIPGLFILRMQPAGRFRMGEAEPPCCGVGTPRPGAGARIKASSGCGSRERPPCRPLHPCLEPQKSRKISARRFLERPSGSSLPSAFWLGLRGWALPAAVVMI